MSTIITKRQFPHYHKYTMDLAGRPLTLEVGKLAELANAAVMVGYGDTRVLCCVTAAPRPRGPIIRLSQNNKTYPPDLLFLNEWI